MHRYFAGLGLLFALRLSASAETLHVAGAGSLAAAFTDLLRNFQRRPIRSRTLNSPPQG